MNRIDTIIPVRDRDTVRETVESLSKIKDFVDKIIVVDQSESSILETTLCSMSSDVEILYQHTPRERFSKSTAINSGLSVSRAEHILVSDADIIWNSRVINDMIIEVLETSGFCYVKNVNETSPDITNLVDKGLWYNVEKISSLSLVKISARKNDSLFRPGPGLVMASRSCWNMVGGYVEEFSGWGWEDVDLLIRAELIRCSVTAVGNVQHITHCDSKRDVMIGGSKFDSRNANFIKSMTRIRDGDLRGNLSIPLLVQEMPTVEVRIEMQPGTINRLGIDDTKDLTFL